MLWSIVSSKNWRKTAIFSVMLHYSTAPLLFSLTASKRQQDYKTLKTVNGVNTH